MASSNLNLPSNEVPPPDPGFTFRIPRVQEWTLGAVVVAALSFGIWIGTLNTKLDHIEKFVDSASDASTGIFVRLATIQKTLDILDKEGGAKSANAASNEFPSINVRIPPIEVHSAPVQQSQGQVLDKLVEYKVVQDMLKPEDRGSAKTAGLAAATGTTSNLDLAQLESIWLQEIKETELEQLRQLEDQVKKDETMYPETKEKLKKIIELEKARVDALRP